MIDVFKYAKWRARFAEAIDHRLYPLCHLDELVHQERAQCWFGKGAAMVTEVQSAPSGARIIHGLVAAGDMEEIKSVLIPRAEAWARSLGCRYAIIESRSGWARALREQGYETHQVALRKEL